MLGGTIGGKDPTAAPLLVGRIAGITERSFEIMETLYAGGKAVKGLITELGRKAYRKWATNRLEKALGKPPGNRKDWTPHHIVEAANKRSPSAIKARQRLWKKFKIKINSAENGVWMKKAGAHPQTYGSAYSDWVYKQLMQANTKDEALEVLGRIRQTLESVNQGGAAPWR